MKTGKTALVILAGVGAGVAIGYWLSSEKSRKLRKKITASLEDLTDDIRQRLMDEFAELKTKAGEIKDKGVTLKDKIAMAVKDLKDDTKQKILDFIEGVHREGETVKKDARQTTATAS